eukprot:1066391_1
MAQSNMLEDLEPDIEQRLAWKVGSTLYIYCDAKEASALGVINAINMDGGKEWLEVRYHIKGGGAQMKLVERYGERIKPYEHDIMAFIEANKKDLFEDDAKEDKKGTKKKTEKRKPKKKDEIVYKVGDRVMRYGERIKPYEHDIMAFIEANKKDLFEEKQ